MIIENYKSKHLNMNMAWIDYRKTFDKDLHNWLIKALELYKISRVIINFLN